MASMDSASATEALYLPEFINTWIAPEEYYRSRKWERFWGGIVPFCVVGIFPR
jgi:hypothetical protein